MTASHFSHVCLVRGKRIRIQERGGLHVGFKLLEKNKAPYLIKQCTLQTTGHHVGTRTCSKTMYENTSF